MLKAKKPFFTVLLVLALLLASVVYADSPVATVAPEEPIAISTPEELAAIADAPNGSYVLAADIDMKGIDWTPFAFSGTLDGAGHFIYNLKVTALGEEEGVTVDGNKKPYPTRYAALFTIANGVKIKDLALLGVDVTVDAGAECAFAACLAGHSEKGEFTNCTVTGRVTLYSGGKMCGVGGLTGFGSGTVTNCKTDVTLVLVDTNDKENCEEFLGAIQACGYADIDGCDIKVTGYASVTGYVHNGGIIGMDHVHDDGAHKGYITNNTVDASIYFYENNPDRRAYCRPVIGEVMNWNVVTDDNTVVNFVNGETTDYSTVLLPEKCENPDYATVVILPAGPGEFGYTACTCKTCGYSFEADFTPYVAAGCTMADDTAQVYYKGTIQLTATVTPDNATNTALTWHSADENIAAVDETGLVTGRGRGETVITCTTADGATASCTVKVGYSWWQWIVIVVPFGWLWY